MQMKDVLGTFFDPWALNWAMCSSGRWALSQTLNYTRKKFELFRRFGVGFYLNMGFNTVEYGIVYQIHDDLVM